MLVRTDAFRRLGRPAADSDRIEVGSDNARWLSRSPWKTRCGRVAWPWWQPRSIPAGRPPKP